MKTKDMVYNGLGFPVLLKDVEVYVSRGEELPKINHNKLNSAVFEYLLTSCFRLTGNQLNFVRGHMGLSQVEFARRLGFDSHATISGWVRKGNNASGMNPQTELAVRMLMAHFINKFEVVNENVPLLLSEIEECRPEISIAA